MFLRRGPASMLHPNTGYLIKENSVLNLLYYSKCVSVDESQFLLKKTDFMCTDQVPCPRKLQVRLFNNRGRCKPSVRAFWSAQLFQLLRQKLVFICQSSRPSDSVISHQFQIEEIIQLRRHRVRQLHADIKPQRSTSQTSQLLMWADCCMAHKWFF